MSLGLLAGCGSVDPALVQGARVQILNYSDAVGSAVDRYNEARRNGDAAEMGVFGAIVLRTYPEAGGLLAEAHRMGLFEQDDEEALGAYLRSCMDTGLAKSRASKPVVVAKRDARRDAEARQRGYLTW